MKTTKENKKPTVVAVSGGFDPIHIGHIRLFEAAKKLGDKLAEKIQSSSWLLEEYATKLQNKSSQHPRHL